MRKCSLSLLGGFSLVSADRNPLPVPTRKDRFVLGYLALSAGQPVPREKLCGLFWGDRDEPQARGSLRQCLMTLRDAFGAVGLEPVRATRDSVVLDPEAVSIDAHEFLAAARDRSRLAEAVNLYRGELLAGLEAPTPESADWLRLERTRLEDIATTLTEAASLSEDWIGQDDGVMGLARQLVQRDKLREPAYRAMMRLAWKNGDKSEAIKCYAACRTALKQELAIEPALATEQLYRDIVTSTPVRHSPSPADSSGSAQRPSLAVMPIDNISADPQLASFCDGLAEEIITGIGRFRFVDVIDRNSSAAIGKLHSDIAEIGAKLGVGMVVNGSLQRHQANMRITVRLVQASSRKLLWSETFDFPAEELPAMPDRIAKAIVATVHHGVELTLLEQSRRKPSLDAFECVLKGIRHIRGYAPDDNRLAVANFDKAIALEPDYALAVAYRGFADIVLHDYDAAPEAIKQASLSRIRKAIEIDPGDARCHWLLGLTLGYCGDFAGDAFAHERALALNPYDANVLASYGVTLAALGRPEEGIVTIREAMRLNPYHPEWYWMDLGSTLYVAKRYGDAAEAYSRKSNPMNFVRSRLAACYAQAGLMKEARREVDEILRSNPDFRLSKQRGGSWGPADLAHFREGMLKAGLPE